MLFLSQNQNANFPLQLPQSALVNMCLAFTSRVFVFVCLLVFLSQGCCHTFYDILMLIRGFDQEACASLCHVYLLFIVCLFFGCLFKAKDVNYDILMLITVSILKRALMSVISPAINICLTVQQFICWWNIMTFGGKL